ncbi:hypothetical protein OHB54_25650 [Streptomyces sp. NBC_01007]|nr:hypothetical protein OHB54_25650 [Streptomyces sp. NBC_01007]
MRPSLFHGLRCGELAALARDEVDLDAELLRIGKQPASISREAPEDEPEADSVRGIELNRDTVTLPQTWRAKRTAEHEKRSSTGAPAAAPGRALTGDRFIEQQAGPCADQGNKRGPGRKQ